METITIKMVMEQNNLNGNWMCYIPEVPSQMYAVPNKKEAARFVNNVNKSKLPIYPFDDLRR